VRGRAKNQKKLVISGTIFLDLESEDQLLTPEAGDVLFYIEVEGPFYPNDGTYSFNGYKGCFRMRVFDGKIWGFLNPQEFFPNKENHFAKSEYPINCYNLCSEIMKKFAGTTIYRTYRDHYTLIEYQPNDFKGKKGNKFKKANS
jgi:hypothetical protein